MSNPGGAPIHKDQLKAKYIGTGDADNGSFSIDGGTLKTTAEQKVVVEQPHTIIIEPANPQVVYVPTYNPTVVYGAWPYPAYPPYPVYNPAWGLMSFGVGLAVGAALWSTPHWGSGSITINNNNFNIFTSPSSPSLHHDDPLPSSPVILIRLCRARGDTCSNRVGNGLVHIAIFIVIIISTTEIIVRRRWRGAGKCEAVRVGKKE